MFLQLVNFETNNRKDGSLELTVWMENLLNHNKRTLKQVFLDCQQVSCKKSVGLLKLLLKIEQTDL